MPQSRGLCGHLRSSQDNHPTCLNCSNCFRGKTCGFCESWSSATWRKFEKRRSYHTKMAKKKESSARKQTALKKRPMKTPEFVESDSGESVVREVIDSLESRLNYRDGASGSSEELSAKSGVPVESRTHPRDYQADSPSRGQKVRHGSESISDPEQRTHLNNELNVHYSESSAGHRANRCSAGKYEEMSNFSDQGTLRVQNTGQDDRALDQVTDHTSLTRSLVSPDTRPPSTVPSIAQPDKGIGSNQVYAPDIAVASTSISDGIVTGSQPRTISTDEIVAGHRVVSECRNSTGHRQSKAPNNLVSLRHASPGKLSPASKLRRPQVRESSALSNQSRLRSRSPSHRMRRNRSRSLSHQEKRNRSKKKKHRHRSSSDSSSSSSSEDRSRKHKRKQKHRRSRSKSRRYDRRPKGYRRHRSSSSYSSFSSEERVFKRPRTDYQRHEHPNDVIRSSSPIRVQSDNQQRSSYCAREIKSPAKSNTEHDISINVRPQDNDFENSSEYRDSVQDPGGDVFEPTENEERASFYQLIEEVFKFLPADRFPRKSEVVESNPRPRSSIELDVKKTQRKSISLPQSPVVWDSVTYIQNSLENTVIGENWIPAAKDIAKLVTMKFYQAHNEKFSTSSASPLDDDANRLGLSLSGNCNLPAKYLEIFEKQCRDNIRLLSHADIFSFAAFKCLQQEKMDPKILSRILESLSSSIKDAIGLSAFTAIGLQQVRRDAAIRAAPRSLADQAKKRLRKTPFASQSLFGGKVDETYKENTETNRGTLVHKAISNQAKSQNSSSQIHKPKSDQKKTTGPKSQPLSNRERKQFSQTPRSARGGHFQRGSGSRGRAPSRRGASSSRKF